MKPKHFLYTFYVCPFILWVMMSGCNKQNEFLDAKPNQILVVPATLNDYQQILNNTDFLNISIDPAIGEISSDDFYVLPSTLSNLSETERNSYEWAVEIYAADQTPADWSSPYSEVDYANTVLDGIAVIKYPASQQVLYNVLKGSALFYRSFAFYNLVQTFALPYDPVSSATDPGIPLRLTADITVKSTRATVQACYDQVITDLKTALTLLPVKSSFPTQPTQAAANAMLARVYLGMSDYANAMIYANACLAMFPVLTDYNTLNSPTTTAVSSFFISEDIYHSSMVNYETIAVRRNTVIDSNLYASYAANDLRRTKFFAILDHLPQYPRFVGSYDFIGDKYDGLATDEIYLIRAECYARAGKTSSAMNDLNTLLVNRWKTGTFQPYTASSADDALKQILSERRKELLYRGLRWTDLRRLNKQAEFKLTQERNINGLILTLPPNDPKYALPIPDAEISISGLTQNPR